MAVYPEDTAENNPCGPEDDGTMPENVKELENLVVGHKIVNAEKIGKSSVWSWQTDKRVLRLTLDDGRKFDIVNTDDCCAVTEVESWILHPENVDNVITSVETENGFTKWHVLADGNDVLTMNVAWSCGNPFYYSYGFHYRIVEVED